MGNRVLIIGAGPAGLGCAHALARAGHLDFAVFERHPYPGGLGASFRDPTGFVWDIGAHLHFRRRPEYIELLNTSLGSGWSAHSCSARIRTHGCLIPHPFQANFRHLPPDVAQRCMQGLAEATERDGRAPAPRNLEEWIGRQYGAAIAAEFLVPYCRKAWSYDPAAMSAEWAGKRFPSGGAEPPPSPPYPAGGNGSVWQSLAARLEGRIRYAKDLARLDTGARRIFFSDGASERYDALVSTIPLDVLIALSDLHRLHPLAQGLDRTSLLAAGLGLKGSVPPMLRAIGWIYSAEPDVPFYRATVQSNLSERNAPAGCWSILLEISHRPGRAPAAKPAIRASVEALSRWGIPIRDRDIASIWVHPVDHAYPVPALGREEKVAALVGGLRERGVYSCGRFGAWRYQGANQDDCFVEGMEIAPVVTGRASDSFTSSRKTSGRE